MGGSSLRAMDVAETCHMDAHTQYTMEVALTDTWKAMCTYVERDRGSNSVQPQHERILRQKYRPNTSGGELSHTFFEEGKFLVDDADMAGIRYTYAIDLLHPKRSKFPRNIERYVPTSFPMFVDVDLKVDPQTCVVDIDELHNEYFLLIQRTLLRFYPTLEDGKATMVICGRPMIHDDGMDKYGYHVHFPRLIVDWEIALSIRESVIAAFRRYYGERNERAGENAWYNVFDKHVYNQKGWGLRTIGSYKMKRDEHEGMVHKQKNPGGKPVTYWPMLAYARDGSIAQDIQCIIDSTLVKDHNGHRLQRLLKMDEVQKNDERTLQYVNNVMKLVFITSVRFRTSVTEGFVMYDGAPKYRPQSKEQAERNAKRFNTGQRIDDVNRLPRSAKLLTSNRGTIITLVEQHLRRISRQDGRPIWPRIEVSEVRVQTARNGTASFYVTVRGDGSHFCMNLCSAQNPRIRGRDHDSNHIYFLMFAAPPYVCQRCYSTSDPVGTRFYRTCDCPAVCCKQFRSEDAGCMHLLKPPDLLCKYIETQAHGTGPAVFNGVNSAELPDSVQPNVAINDLF